VREGVPDEEGGGAEGGVVTPCGWGGGGGSEGCNRGVGGEEGGVVCVGGGGQWGVMGAVAKRLGRVAPLPYDLRYSVYLLYWYKSTNTDAAV
jgi:hypothetical protein